MFRKLRVKFIAITMAMVAVVMAFAFAAACFSEYQRSSTVVQTALSDAIDNAGSADGKQGRNGQAPWDRSSSASSSDSGSSSSADAGQAETGENADAQSAWQFGQRVDGQNWMQVQEDGTIVEVEPTTQSDEEIVPPMIGRRDGGQRALSSLVPVVVFEIEPDGLMHMVPQVTSASISQDVLMQATQELVNGGDGSGVLGDLELHYLKRGVDNRTFMAFADTSYTDSWKSLAFMLVVSGIVTLALFFVVCLFYSRWALRPVREAWDSQRQFVADASHDLKTPLTVILANASILLKHPERTIAHESQWVESTQHEAEEMQQLVNEMLELAQIEAGEQVSIAKERLDFSDIVDGETLMFDSVALERMCSFECDIEDGLVVLGDEMRVKKMVSTLLENAFKYVDDGGTVSVALKQAGKYAKLTIRNTGSVIPPEDLSHVFDRFYRTDKARTSGAGGFGLGLAIARGVALQSGGDITCESNDRIGTEFTVTLPVAS